MFYQKVDRQLFLCMGVAWKKREEKNLKNKWFSVWMDLSETISSVYTPAVGTPSAWTTWPAGSGGDGALRVTSVHKWLPIRKGGIEGGGGCAIICVVEPLERHGWYIETQATCFASISNFCAAGKKKQEGRCHMLYTSFLLLCYSYSINIKYYKQLKSLKTT